MDWSILNVVWTSLALVGSLASGRIVFESFKDYRLVHVLHHGTPNEYIMKLNVARMTVFLFLSIFLTELFFLFIGILALITPPPNRTLNNIVIGLFIAVGAVLAAASVLANYHRRIVIHTGE